MAEVFTYKPEFGAQAQRKPNVNQVKFGDGYEQRISFGMNTIPEIWSLTFANRDETEANAIDAFLKARGATQVFEWTPPGQLAGKAFVCREWQVSPVKHNLFTISARFEEVFEPL